MTKLFGVCAGLLFMVSFAAAAGEFSLSDVAGRKFALQSTNGEAFAGERVPFIEFAEDGALSGRICNNFRGQSEYGNRILTLKRAAATRMLCLDSGLSDLENKFFRTMESGVAPILAGDRLTLRRDDMVLVFKETTGKETDDAAAKATDSAAFKISASDLVGRKFVLRQVDGSDFHVERQPFIEFGEGMRITGSACNNFMGPGELSENVLTVKNAASTMMMCVEPGLAKYESDFHKMLQTGAKIALNGETLTLEGNDSVFTYEAE